MTFNPQFGLTSKETFSYTGDATYNNPTLQGIVAGYVTLLSTDTGVTYLYNSSWKPVNPWSFSNNLYDSTTVTGSFLTYSERAISGSTVSQSGNQGILNNIRAWNIITDYPEYDTGQSKYKKHKQVGLYLGERSPNTVYADSINSGSQAFTIEFDITSSESYSGFQGLTGSTIALTGILNHGVYIQTTTKWDFIECTPEGIRSLNHPDIAIPINLLNPKRVRIGVRDSDLFLATDDGQSVYALGKFDTAHPSAPVNPFIYFGAPFIGVYSGDSTAFSVTHGATGFSSYGFYGNTVWDNIRILTGQLALYYNTGSNPIYSTGIASMTTAPFDPSISLSSFSRAVIEYIPYKGGVTEVYAQYSGVNGWQSVTSTTLSHNSDVAVLDLTSIPIFSYPRTNQGTDYVTNPIRFKIDQYSYNGLGLPPAVEAITVYADKEQYKIDLLPNWKPYNLSTKVSIGVDTGNFVVQDPQPDVWTSFLFNTPKQDTILSSSNSNGYYTDESKYEIPLMFSGSGEFIPGGYYGQCYKNHIILSGSALTGSEASNIFGSSRVSNYFPNPLFSLNFRPITSAEILAFGGTTLNGFLASYAYVPTGYTGIHRIDYSKEVVYRLDTQAEYNRRNQFLGNTLEEQTDYVQRVYVHSNSDATTLDRGAGIELYVPSGIASGELIVGFDINITTGSYLEFYTTGTKSPFKSTIINGSNAREYIRLEVPVTNTGYDSLRLGFVRPYGYPSDELEFYLDNITVSSVNKSYLYFTGITGHLHQSGLITDSYNASLPVPHKASTVIYGDILLESYPIGTTGTFVKLTGASCGVELQILPNGKLVATASHVSDSWSTGQNIYTQNLPQIYLESKDRVPLGTWTNIGFIHDVHNFDKLGNLQYSGNPFSLNFAASNRAYLTFDGDIQASVDLMTGWSSKIYSTDAAPYSSYIPLTGAITGYIASGIMCRVDAVHVARPPIANVESELSIKGSRNLPYFVPDYMFKGGTTGDNILLSTNNSVYGNDLFIGMLYNLSSPSLTNWDRGPLANHLIFYGNRSVEANNPYDLDNIYSTRFNTGYAVVPYSSTVDRLFNTTGQLGIVSSSGYAQGYNNGELRLNGWIYPRQTGVFFTCYQNTGLPNGNRFDLQIGSNVIYNKYNSSGSIVVSVTGADIDLNSWNFINFSFEKNNSNAHLVDGNTGYARVGFQIESTGYFVASTGVDHSFKYTTNSEFRLGTIDCNLFNLAIYFPHSGDQNFVITGLDTSIDKGGRHQALLDGSSLFTGAVSWISYFNGEFTSPVSSTVGQKFYSVALYNSYDDSPKLNGMLLYDNKPFREVNSYHVRYDTAPLERAFGATDSPIRLGTIVPDNAINIARFSSPEYSVDSAINVIDLSDSNVDNLVTYMGGSYSVQPSLVRTSELGSYQNINEPIYTGAIDITFSGQVISSDISFTTVYIPDNNGYFGVPLTQYYLLGRGKNLFKLDNAEPHATGQISDFNSSNAESYVANLERIKSSIRFKDRSGKDITSEIPFDILTSPYSPDSLISAVNSNRNVSLDNIGSYEYATGKLSNGLFSVILLTNIERDDTVFVYYPGYDPYLNKDLYNHKEIVNPQPIFREKHISEEASIGKFDLNLNSNNYYDLTIYGILSGYSDKL